MAGLKCRLSGHKWFTGQESSRCVRCGELCYHEEKTPLGTCKSRCAKCGVEILHHDYVLLDEEGNMECRVCGLKTRDYNIYNKYRAAQRRTGEAGRDAGKAEAEKRRFEGFMDGHRKKEAARGVEEGQFLCLSCDRVLDEKLKSDTYKAPVCRECAGKVKDYYGHPVVEKTEGYKRKVLCIRCFRSEDWEDAEHKGALLKDEACGQ